MNQHETSSRLRRCTLPGQPRCEILCTSNSPHLSQIYTGFAMLHKSGEILLTQQHCNQDHFDASKPQHLRNAKDTHVLVIINSGIRLYYDCHDSFEIDENAASEVDCYFKRSYAQSTIPASFAAKVFSLGMNYEVYSASPDKFEQQRLRCFEEEPDDPESLQFRPSIKNMRAAPNRCLPRRVLFITRAWDPYDVPDRSEQKIAERILINKTRSLCVKLLRKEFGDVFLGGFMHSDYAAKNYADVLLSDDEISKKENYIELLRQYPICVTTTGLHGSIGWKLAEYVAFSRAVVSEHLNYTVPGDFQAGKNYLEFREPSQCIRAVHELMFDDILAYEMMLSNQAYYFHHLKADAMIRRTLQIGLAV
jgi:hypothetical protein